MRHVRFHGAMHPRRAMRTPNNPYRRKREPICWARVLMLVGAILMTASVLAYKWTGPAA